MYALHELIDDPDALARLGRGLPPVVRDVKIKLTSFCNLRCQMCSYWQTRTEQKLDTAAWRGVLSQLADQGGRKVHFSGGEVFLRKDFLDLVEHSVAVGLKTNLTTNGTLLDRDKARRLVEAGANSVSISLDGPNARAHDRIRGRRGAFKQSLRAIHWLNRFSAGVKKPVKIRINFVLMRDNFRRLPEMVRLAGELGAVDLNPMPVDEKGERKNRLSRRQIELYNREIAPEVLALRRRFALSTSLDRVYPFGVTPREIRYSKRGLYARGFFEKKPCLAPWLHMFIAWDGEVYLCCMTNGRIDSLGNVGETTVAGIFGGEAYRRVRERFLAGRHFPTCHRCDLFLRENARLHAALEGQRSPAAA